MCMCGRDVPRTGENLYEKYLEYPYTGQPNLGFVEVSEEETEKLEREEARQKRVWRQRIKQFKESCT